MTFVPVRQLLLATALLFSFQAHAQLDDLFRNPGSPAPAPTPVERKPKANPLPSSPTASTAPAPPATAANAPAAEAPAADGAPAGNQGSAADQRVVIYTTPTCPHCHRALKHMQARNIPYLQKDIRDNPANHAEFKRIGGRGVPHILIGDQVMVGFSPQGFDQRHKAWKASAGAAR